MSSIIRIYITDKKGNLRRVRILRKSLKNYTAISRLGARGSLVYMKSPIRKPVVRTRAKRRIIIPKRVGKRKITPKEVIKRRPKRKRPKKISGVFKRAISSHIIPDILVKPVSEINNEYRELFRNAIRDKDIMDIMITQDNIKKISWRFEIRANVYGIEGERLMTMTKGSGGDLIELKSLMSKGIWRGVRVDYDIDLGNGYKFNMERKGNIDKVEVVILFRS